VLVALGLDGWGYLSTASRADRLLLEHLGHRVLEIHEDDQENLAVRIVNAYSRAQKK
jgi:hypothetical protein